MPYKLKREKADKTIMAKTGNDGDSDSVPAAVPVPFISTDTLQYRIDTQNFGKRDGQRGSLTRVAQKTEPFLNSLSKNCSTTDHENDGSNIDTIRKTKLDLVREIRLADLELSKLIYCSNNAERQIQQNKDAQSKKESKIIDSKKQVDESTVHANNSLQRRNCIMEYESLAKMINDNHPISTTELQKQIDIIQSEISMLEDETIAKDNMLRVREAQFQLLIQYMLDMKQSLKEDDDEDEDADADDMVKPMEVDDLYGDL